jgi:hypothetical protein
MSMNTEQSVNETINHTSSFKFNNVVYTCAFVTPSCRGQLPVRAWTAAAVSNRNLSNQNPLSNLYICYDESEELTKESAELKWWQGHNLSWTCSNSIILVSLISLDSEEINDTKIIEFDQVRDKLWPCHPKLSPHFEKGHNLSQTWSNWIILVSLISLDSEEINNTKIIEFDQVRDKLWPFHHFNSALSSIPHFRSNIYIYIYLCMGD